MTTTQTIARDIPDGTARQMSFCNGKVTLTCYWWAAQQTWVTIPEDDESDR